MSKSPEDSKLSEHHPSFLEIVGDITDISFRVVCHQLLLFSQSIRSLLVAGVTGGFQTLDFSMPFVFAITLIDFVFSFSFQIAYFSLKVSSLIFGLSVIIECKNQNTEVMDITDMTHS